MPKRITHAQFRNGSAQVLRDIGVDREPRVVTNHGEPVAVLHPATDEEIVRAESGLDIAAPAARGRQVDEIFATLASPRALPDEESVQSILDEVRG